MDTGARANLRAAALETNSRINRTYEPGATNRGESAALVGPQVGLRADGPGASTMDNGVIETPNGRFGHEGTSLSEAAPAGHIIPGASDRNAVIRVGTDDASRLRQGAPERPVVPQAEIEGQHRQIRAEETANAQRDLMPGETVNDPAVRRDIDSRVALRVRELPEHPNVAAGRAHDERFGQTTQAAGVTQHTTGTSSCGAIVVRGTANGRESYRAMTHAAAENPVPQYTRMTDEIGHALSSGATDIRTVISIDGRAMQRPQRNDPNFVNDQYHSFPPPDQLHGSVARTLADQHPEFRFTPTQRGITATPVAGGPPREILIHVETAQRDPNSSAGAPLTRAVTATDDGTIVRTQETGHTRLLPWSEMGRR